MLAKDVVASLTRWSARDPMGLMLKAIQNELVAVDDRTFKWVLKKPLSEDAARARQEQHAVRLHHAGADRQDRSVQADHRICRLRPDAVRARTNGCPAPRRCSRNSPITCRARSRPPGSPAARRSLVDRIEWIVMPDPATASAALQNGEVDWWENPISDLVPSLKNNRNIMVDIADPLGNIGSFRMNHLHPPFNDVKVRRAVLMALSQEDYMRALVGDDDKLWKPLPGFFTPGTPLYTEEGGDILKGKRDLDAAKKLLAESRLQGRAGHLRRGAGPADHQGAGRCHRRSAEAARHECRFRRDRLGHGRPRRAQKTPPGQGGWHVPHLACRRRLHQPGRLHRDPRQWRQCLVRLAERPEVEKEIAAWFEAKTLDEEKAAMRSA